jgi:hypothetical protein
MRTQMCWRSSRAAALITRGHGASQGRANFFCNFALVAAATPELQNVLVRSWVAVATPELQNVLVPSWALFERQNAMPTETRR